MALKKESLRNLPQYREMEEEEFEKAYQKMLDASILGKDYIQRKEEFLKGFEKDYDTTDMKYNDIATLNAMADSYLSLEDYEKLIQIIRDEGVDRQNIQLLKDISKIASDLRSDISKMQDDLKITRKIRKSTKEESVIAFIEDLKTKAQEFYEEKMMYVYCPHGCNTLLATAWFLYPESKSNRFFLYCPKCQTNISVTSKELLDNKGKNLEDKKDL